MPEGVEVRKFADILIHNIVGHNLTAVNILKGRYTKKVFDGYNELTSILPAKVISVKCKGKMTYIELYSKKTDKTVWLINTLGLTGGWTAAANEKKGLADFKGIRYLKGSIKKVGDKDNDSQEMVFAYPLIWEYISNNNMSEWFEHALNHLNVEFVMDNNRAAYFYDQLSFGTLKVLETKKDMDKKLGELGADMLEKETTFEVFDKAISKGTNKAKPIGNVIVNQKLVSGVGNYLRADALWMARISPFRKVDELSKEEKERIYKSIRALMWGDFNPTEAKKIGYITADFKIPHDYGREFFVYRQEKDIDGRKVEKRELYEGSQKRTIFWVPEVQNG
jgi:formamidopyrimidine-DNA glycosylase